MLVAPDDAAAADLGATPLFSPSARRRDVVKLLLEGEAGVNSAANAYTARAGAGLRLCDFVELTARASPQPFNGAQHLLYGGRIGLHIDGDGDPLTAFAVGGELVGRAFDGGSLMQLGLVVGPRLGIGDRLFASALLSPSLVWWKGFADRGDGYAGQLLITVELGVGL